jgi:hypothetical protein
MGWAWQVRCPMVEIIALGTMVALGWLIAWSMAGECESEKRRIAASRENGQSAGAVASDRGTRHAA